MPIYLQVGTNEMSSIIKPDPYLEHYIFQKEQDPNSTILLKAFKRDVVDAVDTLVKMAHGQRELVTSENDWQIVEEIFNVWAKLKPDEYASFKASIGEIKEAKNHNDNGGYSDSGEIMHVGSIPPRLMNMIKAIFPLQQWDKKFTSKFVNKFRLFKVGERINQKYY